MEIKSEARKLKQVRILLIISICINVFFIGSAVAIFRTVKMLSTPKGRYELTARSLKLTDIQKDKLKAIYFTLQEYRNEKRSNSIEETDELCSELSKDDPDYAKIDKIIGMMVDARKEFLGFVSVKIEPFLSELTLDQRLNLVNKIRKIQKLTTTEQGDFHGNN